MKKRIIDLLLSTKTIDNGQLEIYNYGLQVLMEKYLQILCIIILGIIGKELGGTVVYLIFYCKIREYAGGYHASTITKCRVCSLSITIAAIAILKIIPKIHISIVGIIIAFCGVLIFFLSPQQSENKPLTYEEKSKYRIKVFKYYFLSLFLFLIGYRYTIFVKGVTCALVCVSFMLIVGKIKQYNK